MSEHSYTNEFRGAPVSGDGHAYARLGGYNLQYFKEGAPKTAGAVRAAANLQTSAKEVVVVPTFGGPSYNVSQSSVQDTDGKGHTRYTTLRTAYPRWPRCGM